MAQCSKLRAPKDQGKAYLMAPPGSPARLRALAAVYELYRTISMSSLLELAGQIVGYGIIAFMAFTGNIASIGFMELIGFQLFWMALILLNSCLRKF